jgi:hypothetical protein
MIISLQYSVKTKMINRELQEKIIQLLKNNNGEMELNEVCSLLSITSYDVPWGYNIGYAKCLQVGGVYHLLLSNSYTKLST